LIYFKILLVLLVKFNLDLIKTFFIKPNHDILIYIFLILVKSIDRINQNIFYTPSLVLGKVK
jgi:hypothetical protein